jgi:hypothetical protein
MSENLIAIAERLNKIEQGATPKPWKYGSHPDHCQIGCDDCVEPSDPNCPNPIKSDWQPIAMIGWGDVVPGVFAKPYNYNKEANRNGELVEELRNAAPDILQVLKCFQEGDAGFIEKQAEDPFPSGGGMNAVPNAFELERNRYLVRGP